MKKKNVVMTLPTAKRLKLVDQCDFPWSKMQSS